MTPLFTKIKGTLMIQIVKLVRTLRNDELMACLTEKERELIDERVLPTTWYSGESARHIIKCLHETVARGDADQLRQWGLDAVSSAVPASYFEFLVPGDPLETLRSFSGIFRSFLDAPGFRVVENRPGYFEATFSDTGDNGVFAPFTHMLGGWIEGLIGLAGGRVSRSGIRPERIGAQDAVVYRIEYDPPCAEEVG